jgi:hypothetical protein
MRIPKVLSEPITELDEFQEPFRVNFGCCESQPAVEQHLIGLLRGHRKENRDALAGFGPGAHVFRKRHFDCVMTMGHRSWPCDS